MVYHIFGTSYLTKTDATEYRDIDRISGDHNEDRRFTSWGECNWYEIDIGAAGELDALVARH